MSQQPPSAAGDGEGILFQREGDPLYNRFGPHV
jgi:hypothetical protein